MSEKFYTVLTEHGEAAFAQAIVTGVPVNITEMAVGDGGGALPEFDKTKPGWSMKFIAPASTEW